MNSNDLNRNYQFLKDLGAFEQPSNELIYHDLNRYKEFIKPKDWLDLRVLHDEYDFKNIDNIVWRDEEHSVAEAYNSRNSVYRSRLDSLITIFTNVDNELCVELNKLRENVSEVASDGYNRSYRRLLLITSITHSKMMTLLAKRYVKDHEEALQSSVNVTVLKLMHRIYFSLIKAMDNFVSKINDKEQSLLVVQKKIIGQVVVLTAIANDCIFRNGGFHISTAITVFNEEKLNKKWCPKLKKEIYMFMTEMLEEMMTVLFKYEDLDQLYTKMATVMDVVKEIYDTLGIDVREMDVSGIEGFNDNYDVFNFSIDYTSLGGVVSVGEEGESIGGGGGGGGGKDILYAPSTPSQKSNNDFEVPPFFPSLEQQQQQQQSQQQQQQQSQPQPQQPLNEPMVVQQVDEPIVEPEEEEEEEIDKELERLFKKRQEQNKVSRNIDSNEFHVSVLIGLKSSSVDIVAKATTIALNAFWHSSNDIGKSVMSNESIKVYKYNGEVENNDDASLATVFGQCQYWDKRVGWWVDEFKDKDTDVIVILCLSDAFMKTGAENKRYYDDMKSDIVNKSIFDTLRRKGDYISALLETNFKSVEFKAVFDNKNRVMNDAISERSRMTKLYNLSTHFLEHSIPPSTSSSSSSSSSSAEIIYKMDSIMYSFMGSSFQTMYFFLVLLFCKGFKYSAVLDYMKSHKCDSTNFHYVKRSLDGFIDDCDKTLAYTKGRILLHVEETFRDRLKADVEANNYNKGESKFLARGFEYVYPKNDKKEQTIDLRYKVKPPLPPQQFLDIRMFDI